jgi:monoamine oxidase
MQRRDFLAAGTAGVALALSACERHAPIEGGFNGIDIARGHALRDGTWRGAPARTRRTGVLIVGGGVAGLAAARALRLQGIEDFALLELEDQAGGNARGARVNGVDCPMGAHYLPVPGDSDHVVQDLLEELGLRRRVAGRWEYDQIHLCHSPQERLFFQGHWQDGLLPVQGVPNVVLAQYRRFAQRIDALRRQAKFSIPVAAAKVAPLLLELDELSFANWLTREGFNDPHLRWYLDYCCRDDYGAGHESVSAWAGVHYFASRHGFQAPDTDREEYDAVLTWPQGNAWLTQRLAAPLGERLHGAQVVFRIAETRDGVEADAFDVTAHEQVRWQAQRCIVALPIFIAARIIENPPAVLRTAARGLRYSPWLVANAYVRAPLPIAPREAPPSWDNVLYGTAGLGYVDARHQDLDPTPRATVLSWYRPLGPSGYDAANVDGRQLLQDRAWSNWRDDLLIELSAAHPNLPELVTRIDITRYGHAMAIPTPGRLRQLGAPARVATGRLAFAHADWSGYSIFEEAFTRGHMAV